jgi:hypothetical protein
MATRRDIEAADQAGRKGSGPGKDNMGDPGIAYPPEETERAKTSRVIARLAFGARHCPRHLQPCLHVRPRLMPGDERAAAVSDVLDMLFAPPGPARGSNH